MKIDRRSVMAICAVGVMSFSVAGAQSPSSDASNTAMKTNESGTKAEIVRYSGTVVRSMPNTRPFELRLDRWSSEADRNAVVGAFKAADNPAAFADALKDMPIIGGFRTISGQPNPVRYAEKVTDADGTEKLIILSDRQVDYWQGGNASRVVRQGYTLMEIRFDGETGEGVASHGPTPVVVDAATNTLTIEEFEEKPAQLIGVKQLERDEQFDLDAMMDDLMDTVDDAVSSN